MIIRIITCSFIFIFTVTLNSKPQLSNIQNPIDNNHYYNPIIDSIINLGKKYLNKPYRYKENNNWTFDCSGFLSFLFYSYGYEIPRSSSEISNKVKTISINESKKGDVLLFKGRDITKNRVGHVALVIENDNGNIKMLHSCRRGIKIDDYPDSGYYLKRFIKAGRFTFFQDTIKKDSSFSTLPIYNKKDTLNITDTLKTKLEQKTINVFSDTISIIGVGDIMLGTNYPSDKFLPPHDGKYLLEPVKSILQDAHITTGNLEGTLLTRNATPRGCRDSSVCYRFKMPEHYIKYLEEAGFDFLNLANNHINDFGEIGKQNTIRVLKESTIKFAGLEECPYSIIEKNGIKFGFCGFSPHTGTINISDIKKVKSIVKHLDTICNIVIVSMHIGAEGADHRHINGKDEMFLGQNRGNPYKFVREVIDAGADIVFGHGPHVTRAVDLYKGRFIAYSLGNFATYSRFNLKGVSGLAPILKVYVNKKGEFLFAEVFSIIQLGEGGPVLDPNNRAFSEIKMLTETDIPEANLYFKENKILKKD